MPAANAQVIRRILNECEAIPVKASTIPKLSEIVLGKIKLEQLRPIRTEDLLGRPRIHLNGGSAELVDIYGGKRILVTGAGGSIGSELVRQLSRFGPELLLMLDKDENGLYEVNLHLREEYGGEIIPLVANVRDRERLERLFHRYRPQIIFHAASYKHVPMMEREPAEAVLNNVIGSKNVIELASKHGAERFVEISTDKAVNPTSIMGATKRVVEMLVRRQAMTNGATRFCCVRFGNVLGSRASVVPLFEKWIAQRKTIKITHPQIERYFMTIPEAVQLVIQAGTMANVGETFALDMGDPVKIVDLAREMIKRSGLVVGQDIEIEFTGLRPGEKLFEELLYEEEQGARSEKYPKILVGQPLNLDTDRLARIVQELERAAREGHVSAIYDRFQALRMGYTPPTQAPAAMAAMSTEHAIGVRR